MRSPEDYRQAVDALILSGGEAGPGAYLAVLLWARDGSRLVWNSDPSATDGLHLARGEPAAPVGQSLRLLSERLPSNGALRIEKLRLGSNPMRPAQTCLCRLVEIGDERLVLTAIHGRPAAASRRRMAEPSRQLSSGPTDAAPPAAGVEGRLERLRERGRQRFVWQADAMGRFTFVSDTLADVVGGAMADILGRTWDEIAGSLVEDADREVSRLFARHEAWSGRTVLWRIADTDHAVPVDLAGIPAIGAEREVLGFRGFGVCRTDAITPHSWSSGPLAPAVETAEQGAGATDSPPTTEDAGPLPSEPSPRRPESGMDDTMLALAEPAFGHLTARASARLGLPRAVPLRAREGAPGGAGEGETVVTLPISRHDPAPDGDGEAAGRLSPAERNAFREIARALSARSDAAPIDDGRQAARPSPVGKAPDGGGWLPGVPVESDPIARLGELSAILDTVTDGIILIDGSMRILSFNRSAEALFGYDQSEVRGERLDKLFAPESHAAFLDYFAGLQRNGVGSVFNDGHALTGRVRQGGTFALAMTIGRIGETAGDRFCVVLRDVTSQAVVERELDAARGAAADSSAQRADFLGRLSHEIRTPLNSVIGFAEIMLEERSGPLGSERYRDYLRDIRAAGGQVVGLVDGLLNLARIEAGRMELCFADVSLNPIVSACVEASQAQAMRGRIVLRTSFGSHLPAVMADENSVRQIVQNLLSNAVAFTQAGGQVIVSTALTERGELAFRVRDTGIGMSREDIEAALEPLRKVSSRRSGGVPGLGLSLTKALVEANRAELQITSAPRQGTLVEVLFPASRILAPQG